MSNRQRPTGRTHSDGPLTPFRRGTAVVADAPQFPHYWAKRDGLLGQRIAVVEVLTATGSAYLDNRTGQAWYKVTIGNNSPKIPHANVAIEPGSFVETSEVTGR